MSLIDVLVSILFGIVEGITEWLPISSTGHMILLDEFIKLNVSPEFFDLYLVVIQLGAILGVIILFWTELWPFGIKNVSQPVGCKGVLKYCKKDYFIMWFKIVVACIPGALYGVFLDDLLSPILYNYVVVSLFLILFGIAFIIVENYIEKKQIKPTVNSLSEITFKDAFIIGLFQLIAAIFPGTSRSGATILGGLMIRINREVAAKFTFFLAIPVMLGASLLKILKFEGTIIWQEIILLVIGMITAFVVTIFVIKKLMSYVKKHDFKVFGWYRIILGIIVLVVFSIIK